MCSVKRAVPLTKRDQIERYVRSKNRVYLKWRIKFDFDELEGYCAEALLRFGPLPKWEEYVQATRSQDWHLCAVIKAEHTAWRHEVRTWCLDGGITTYRNQAAQFIRFYFAWYRWQYEERHGKITRTYGRQMQ